MKNKLLLIGLLGFLGLLGPLTNNTGFYGFFGFFGFFGFSGIIPDERFKENVGKAAKNAFFISIVLFALSTIYVSLSQNIKMYSIAYALGFAVQILVFSISLQVYEGRN